MGDEVEHIAAHGAGQLRSGTQPRRQPSHKGQSSEEPSKFRSAPSAADGQPASEQKEGKLRKRFMRWPLSGLAEKTLLRAGVDEDVSRQGVPHTCPQCKQAAIDVAALCCLEWKCQTCCW